MKILIINPNQFGYYAGYYHYCKYLKGKFDIDFVCMDQGLPKVEMDGVNVKYINTNSNKKNWRIFLYKEIRKMEFSKYNFIFTTYFKYIFISRFFGLPRRAVVDIRTGDLSTNEFKRGLWNRLIKFETHFFKSITILSNSLLKELNLKKSNCHLLTLGSDYISTTEKKYNTPKLLYVGTLHKRNIDKTIYAFSKFQEKYKVKNISYDIIGFGNKDEENDVNEAINNLSLNKVVKFHGRKNYEELVPFFDNANIGMSYIPITRYFNCQPPTKTFEYSLSGLINIATDTDENRALINADNGVLCDDTINGVANAIEQLYLNRETYNYYKIKSSLKKYLWANVVENNLIPIIESNSK